MSILGQAITAGGGVNMASIKVTGDIANTDTCYARYGGLPAGYEELEYIESNGNQYIDTGINTTLNTEVDIEFNYTEFVETGIPFGANVSGDVNKQFCVYMIDVNTIGTYATGSPTTKTIDTTQRMNIEYNKYSSHKIRVNDADWVTNSALEISRNIWLFGANDSAGNYHLCKMRLYELTIYTNNVLVRNYVPCKRLIDNAIGLLDTANNVFYGNSGTGTFTAGPSVTPSSQKSAQWKSIPNPAYHNLPSGYTEVEYIESSGTQYIDTGVSISSANTISGEITAEYLDNNNVYLLNAQGYGGTIQRTLIRPFVPSTSTQWLFEAALNTKYKYEFSNTSLKVNDNTINSSSTSYTTTGNILIFRKDILDMYPYHFYGNNKLYSLKLYINGTLARNLVPAKRNSDGAIGLYNLAYNANDVATGLEFYTNAGTGEFIAGDVIPSTLPCWLIDKISAMGTWTVHWSDGTKTKEVDVLIDTITGYTVENIEIGGGIYLYKDGDECIDVTGGYKATNYIDNAWTQYGLSRETPTLIKNSNNLTINMPNNNKMGTVFTNNTIDLYEYSTLKIHATQTGYEGLGTQFGISSANSSDYSMENSTSLGNNSEISIDISNYMNSTYFAIESMRAFGDDVISCTVTKVWLE